MLTLFTVPKPFVGHIAVIQRNAIQSWMRLDPRPEIVLMGRDAGVAEVAQEFGLRHLPDLEVNRHGTPLVSDIFAQAERVAQHPVLGYINADIILLSDFLPAVATVRQHQQRFMLIGQRLDCPVEQPLDFSRSDWERVLRDWTTHNGGMHGPCGMDYFVYPKGVLGAVVPMALGRTLWDGWLVLNARRLGLAVVDATHWITVVHQNHGYAHGLAASAPNAREAIWKGVEAQENARLHGNQPTDFGVRDANWRVNQLGVRRVPLSECWRRELLNFDALYPQPTVPQRILRQGLRSWLAIRTATKAMVGQGDRKEGGRLPRRPEDGSPTDS